MIKINDVSFHYKKGTPILDRIQTTIQSGHIYGLLGLNGVGKTTLLKVIAGLLFPRKGDLQVNDFNPENRTIPFLSDIYFITDEVELPNWSITDIIRVYAPLYPKFDLSYFEQLLQAFQIDTKKQVNDFSYGQRKKVNIAFGLATNVSTLLMDEPTNGLDIPSKAQFRKIISQFVAEDKVIIISTHQIRDIHNLIDHLLILDNNRLILDDSIYQLGKKLKFSTDPSDVDQAWYSEVTIHGPVSLLPNSLEEDSSFDIEFFFNAISANRNIIAELKKTTTYHE